MWSELVSRVCGLLRGLAPLPAALLAVLWGHHSLLFRLLRHVDDAVNAIVFSSGDDEQRKRVARWLGVEGVQTAWRHGWLVCARLDAALPGVCAGHPRARLSLHHAMTIAQQHLGLEPVFCREELEYTETLTQKKEWKLVDYLDRLREELSKVSPGVSKATTPCAENEKQSYSLEYYAEGHGLNFAQTRKKSYFTIYPTEQQTITPNEIVIAIHGPNDAYGTIIIPPLLGKTQRLRQKLLGLEAKESSTQNILPLTQGTAYFRSIGKSDIRKTFFVPRRGIGVNIDAIICEGHAEICYQLANPGTYEISITTRSNPIIGSPFKITVANKIINNSKHNYDTNDFTQQTTEDKQVVLRIVDFITEKMIFNENGEFLQISDEKAKNLLDPELEMFPLKPDSVHSIKSSKLYSLNEKKRFKVYVNKIVLLLRICNKLQLAVKEQKRIVASDVSKISNVTDIVRPDNERKTNSIQKHNDLSKCSEFKSISTNLNTNTSEVNFSKKEDDMGNHKTIIEKSFYKNLSMESSHISSSPKSNNLFAEILDQSKDISDDVQAPPVEIIIDEELISQPASLCSDYPFVDPKLVERPKTPVLKIITGDLLDRVDSPYIRQTSLNDEIEGIRGNNEFLNPLFVHDFESDTGNTEPLTADFIIGAPVSITPVVRTATPKPHINSAVTVPTSDPVNNLYLTKDYCFFDQKTQEEAKVSTDATFHSTGSIDLKYSLEPDSLGSTVNPQSSLVKAKRPLVKTQAKDTWDSAYVSIDECGGSPESGNITLEHNKISSIYPEDLELSDIPKMGPAEKELWENLKVLNHSDSQILSEKERQFSPIIEEKDRSMPISLDTDYIRESDLVVGVDADTGSIKLTKSNLSENTEFVNIKQDKLLLPESTNQNKYLYSASDLSDMNTEDSINREEPIFEVQNLLAERSYLSRTLDHHPCEGDNKVVIFGEKAQKSIVLERKKFWDEKIKERNKLEKISDFEKSAKNCGLLQEKDEINKSIQFNQKTFDCHNTQICNMKKKPKPSNMVNKRPNCYDDSLEIDQNMNAKPNDKESSPQIYKKLSFSMSRGKSFDSYQGDAKYSESSINDIKSHKNTRGDITGTVYMCLSNPEVQETQKDVSTEDNLFKAFETSPKRFFGQSRKNIITKIENCEISKPESNDVLKEFLNIKRGIVSNRIDMYDTKENIYTEQQGIKLVCKNYNKIFENHKNGLVNKDAVADRKALLEEIRNCWNEKKSYVNKNDGEILIEDNNNKKISRISTSSNTNTSSSETNCLISHCNEQSDDSGFPNMNDTEHVNNEKENNIPNNLTFPSIPSILRELSMKSNEHASLKSNKGLRKSIISKSEMDIFNKTKFKYIKSLSEEIPKVNVKSYINIFESTYPKKEHSIRSFDKANLKRQNNLHRSSYSLEKPTKPEYLDSFKNTKVINIESTERSSTDNSCQDISLSLNQTMEKVQPKNTNKHDEVNTNTEREACIQSFKRAKDFFQSMDELRTISTPKKLNECELLLYNESNETSKKTDKNDGEKNTKAKIISKKSHSAPCSENEFDRLSSCDNKRNDDTNECKKKLVRISEKFQVEDLFNDVIGDRNLSRTGSFRGIPNKRAVLDTFRSMENMNKRLTSYDIAVTQLSQFAKDNNIRNAQTCSTEYPYLPKTEPARYRSRCDVNASGLISREDLLNNEKQRRYSVPDGFVLNDFTMRFTSSL